MTDTFNGFGERVREALERRGMKASDLGAQLERKPAIVSHWLTGKRKCPAPVVADMARILRVNRTWLSSGSGSPEPPTGAAVGQSSSVRRHQSKDPEIAWSYRVAPADGGRDFGNANTYATPPDIPTFVREIGQNSTDAAHRLGGAPQPVTLRFSLIELTRDSDAYSRFLSAIDFSDLKTHIAKVANEAGGRSKLAAKLRDGLTSFEADRRIVLLRVDDYGTVGLSGEELGNGPDDDTQRSSPYAALVRNNLDSSKDASTAGGSYGLGKAVLWNCSGLSTVLFASTIPDDARGTRLTGRTELTWHRLGENSFAGPAWFGTKPFGHSVWCKQNDLLRDLCLSRDERLPDGVNPRAAWGTSALVVGFRDPEAEGAEESRELLAKLAKASAENFFPAILTNKLRVFIDHTVDGTVRSQTEVSPDDYVPEFCAVLRAHINNEVSDALDEPGASVRREILHRIPGTKSEASAVEQFDELQAKGYLIVRYDEDTDEGSPKTLANSVALVRGRGMVVKYWNRDGIAMGAKTFHAIFLAGEGVASDTAQRGAEQFLRLAEPPPHNEWEPRQELKAAYKQGARMRLRELRESITAELRAVVQPQTGGADEGPEELKRLLQFGTSVDPKRPVATLRDISAAVIDGEWTIEAQIHFNDRGKRLRVSPRAWIDVESGGAIRLPWQNLSFFRGRKELSAKNDGIEVDPGGGAVTMRGVTARSVQGIEAILCRAKLDLVSEIVSLEGTA